LWGLLHDAAEAYLCDLPRPVKREPEMEMYRAAENRLLACVALKFGLAPEMPESVKQADRVLLATEFRDVTTVGDLDWIIAECGIEPLDHRMYTIDPWPSIAAEDNFLRRFRELTK
jgi:5'-deoxynucleotidase YfbR-like HD superfamily hydrolase